MDFLACVNRVLRVNGIIRGDTDAVASFSDTQHNATLNLAIVAIQDELGDLIAEKLIPYEFSNSSLAIVAGTRVYDLAADFIRFYGNAFFYDATNNWEIYEYKGGRTELQSEIPNYKTTSGYPTHWYWEPGSTRQVGFYQVPSTSATFAYDYEKSVMVTLAGDTIPLHSTEEANQFTLMCGRRFKILFEDVDKMSDIAAVLDVDVTYKRAKASLLKLMRGTNPPTKYSATYL